MSKKKILVVAGASTAALLSFGVIFTFAVSGSAFGASEKLRFAMDLLDEGRWDVPAHIARELAEQGKVDPDSNADWQYVQGVSKLQSVENNLDSPKNRGVLLEAVDHLSKAEELGFPKGYQGKGKYYLGWCCFQTYRWESALAHLKDSERLWPEKRSEAFKMQVEAELRKVPANYLAAESTLRVWSAIPGLSSQELAKISLAAAQLAFARLDVEACERFLNEIPAGLPEYYDALLWKGRWRLELPDDRRTTGQSKAARLEEAGEIIRRAKLAADTPNDIRRQATYLAGRILRAQGKYSEAMSTFSGTRQSSPHSAEAIAAGMEESEILLEEGMLDDALANLHHLLRNIEDLLLFNELWMSKAEFRARLLDFGRQLRGQGEYESAIQLAEHIGLAFPLADSVRLQAEALEQWADHLAANPRGNTIQSQQQQRQQLTAKYLAAADQYELLARLELRSAEYPDIVWRAIQNYQNAGELQSANALLVEYLRFEDRTKRPRGFLALGRNYMNAGQWQKALEPLDRCLMEHPTHPISFEARLLAAKANYELDRLDEAIELLNENLYGNSVSLQPKSEIWRNSLYQLGQTIFRQGDRMILELRLDSDQDRSPMEAKLEESHVRFLEAVDRLGEFVSRYPDDPRLNDAMYLVAKSHRLAAETPQQIARAGKAVVDAERRQLMQQRRGLLDQALQEFRELHRMLTLQQDGLAASEQNAALIRNCHFGEADTLYDLGRWEEAIAAYRNVASGYQPESLEALMQIAQCHRKLGQEDKAKKILAQAEQLLNRIPPELDGQFVSLTRTSRQGWSDLIGSLRNWN